ncbi:Inactive peptidyl-prolyl cis-trans isomerase FKBP6 [Geodia barretti]|uniref:peptidylprolyl isomerase n=2 Tax=Geodia barretti TaxID=519541 RepID=A0AA35RPH1_GEOBA|nr:Inactive peptidyl-prolyl cis-trans isomerase FKBP6 [Geodia barretti]
MDTSRYSDEPYDSSRLRGKQQQFVLGNGEVIPGLEVAVKSMKRNERSQFLVSSEYGFGKLGCPPRIPPNATILFEVELLGFVEYHTAEGEEEGRNQSFEQRLAAANSEREVGNDYFQQNMIGRAVGRYLKAVRQLEAVRLRDANQEAVWRTSLKKLYLNLSLCSLRQRKSQLALSNCRRVLELDGKNVKAFFRIGQAYLQLGDFKNSRKHLQKANKLSPHNKEIQQELRKLENTRKRFQSMERTMYANMFQHPTRGVDDESREQEPVHFHSREELTKKLRELSENPGLLDLVLPQCLTNEEVFCATEIARELGLRTEKSPDCGLRIFKPGVQPEDFEQYLR